jgi:hypothetical protein
VLASPYKRYRLKLAGYFPNGGVQSGLLIRVSASGTTKTDDVAGIQTGTASVVSPFDAGQLAEYSRTVMANSPYRDSLLDNAGSEPGSPIPSKAGGATPIKRNPVDEGSIFFSGARQRLCR